MSLNAINLGIGGDRVENVLWRAISLLLPLSVRNIVVPCGTNNISTDSSRDIVNCIVDGGTIFWRNLTEKFVGKIYLKYTSSIHCLYFSWWKFNRSILQMNFSNRSIKEV